MRAEAPSPPPSIRLRGARGFTLIELLVAMAILITLVSLLVIGLGGKGIEAQSKATKATIEKIRAAMANYHSEFRDYPPDGYDQEAGWNVNNAGVVLGVTPSGGQPLRFKGTGSLIYFLCRPLVAVSIVGNPNDPKSLRSKRVGPFLIDMKGSDFSRADFDPTHPWQDSAYWQINRVVELVDAFGRPLCYDKVKSDQPTHFQPARFHNRQGLGTGGQGAAVHSDEQAMRTMDLLENSSNAVDGMSADQRLAIHLDPRFINGQNPSAGVGDPVAFWVGQGGWTGTYDPATKTGSHEPKNSGAYDLWSYGPSYFNPNDDIVSWE